MTSHIPTARLEEIVAAWDTPETVFISEKDILALVTELLAAREALAYLNARLDEYWNDPMRAQADHAEHHARQITLAQAQCRALLPQPEKVKP